MEETEGMGKLQFISVDDIAGRDQLILPKETLDDAFAGMIPEEQKPTLDIGSIKSYVFSLLNGNTIWPIEVYRKNGKFVVRGDYEIVNACAYIGCSLWVEVMPPDDLRIPPRDRQGSKHQSQ